MLKCGIVLLPVVVAEVAPVTAKVALEIGHGIEDAALDQLAHAAGHNDLAGLDAGLIGNGRCHGDYLSKIKGHGTPRG
jgi:hypothetical protein